MRLFRELGAEKLHRITGLSLRRIYARRQYLEKKYRLTLVSPTENKGGRQPNINHPGQIEVRLQNGIVLIGSDCHYWPGPPSLMHRAFVKFCKELKPAVVILNGDVIDACSISRFLPVGWTSQPTVQQEIEAAQERVGEIEAAASRARKLWPIGNHDQRFETSLASKAREFAKVKGTSLTDHFTLWEPCYRVDINDDVVVKHRISGGIHAIRNNVLKSGRTTITGHLHAQNITAFTDYNGTRFGVDAGCIAEPSHKAFLDYTEASPKDWRSGFCVLTFQGGQMLPPELVYRWTDDSVVFRGAVIDV